MFINKTKEGKNNCIGQKVECFRKSKKLSQREFADKLQIEGLEIDKNAIQRIECGKRFVTDIELVHICRVMAVSPNELLEEWK